MNSLTSKTNQGGRHRMNEINNAYSPTDQFVRRHLILYVYAFLNYRRYRTINCE